MEFLHNDGEKQGVILRTLCLSLGILLTSPCCMYYNPNLQGKALRQEEVMLGHVPKLAKLCLPEVGFQTWASGSEVLVLMYHIIYKWDVMGEWSQESGSRNETGLG